MTSSLDLASSNSSENDELVKIDSRRLRFDREVSDGMVLIRQDSHKRFAINMTSFSQQAALKGKQQ